LIGGMRQRHEADRLEPGGPAVGPGPPPSCGPAARAPTLAAAAPGGCVPRAEHCPAGGRPPQAWVGCARADPRLLSSAALSVVATTGRRSPLAIRRL